MKIPERFRDEIRSVNVNSHKVEADFSYWTKRFKRKKSILALVQFVEKHLTNSFGRAELVNFYKRTDIRIETKFLAAMIWGREPPAGSRRDHRGPSKVEGMFLNLKNTSDCLESVAINTDDNLEKAYRTLCNIPQLGPSFLTKHLYFLGKSKGGNDYPLIFDDRVAGGLVKLFLKDGSCADLVTIHALRTADAYIKYLRFARAQAKKFDCAPDQIEYFLFKHAFS